MKSQLHILGIDIGGTKTIVGVGDRRGNILASRRIDTPGSMGPERALAAIKTAAREVIDQVGGEVGSIGIACGGPLDRETGILDAVPNLPGWKGISLTKEFSDEFGLPACVDNDATAAALGEYMFGAGRGCSDMVYMNCSTGIGGGIIIGGKPYRGCNGNAGEFGHQKISPDGPPCPCGDRGCLEAFASGTSIARFAREGLAQAPGSLLWKWVSTPDDVTAELVAKATAEGDEFASGIWYEAMRNYGIGVANVVNALNPRLVVLAGGVTKAGDLMFEPVRKVVAERAMRLLAEAVEIVPAANGDMMGLMGAFALSIEQFN
ncbi:MAG: hypothetical protein A2Z18_07670 [Armatimonadetes bacterium RBG_16_58_9]|nr:MAG: hypothetical protein A2Z18_07670 [Armatimonadetes bacterium RBG_16_58_9]